MCQRKPPQTTPLHHVPESVVITRSGHPFEGRRLQVISRRQRAGRLHLLLTLPDQSRGLIPADWTDFAAGSGSVPASTPALASDTLGSIADLLHARLIIDALLRQTEQESNDATEPTPRGSAVRRRQPVGTTRSSDTRRGNQRSRPGDREARDPQQPDATGEQ
ncbi:hypothetical protein KAF44_30610 (plasmid) [Cupriavidus necator]|nr:hypothetical protein KAF44_21630 [Cupriavidus necator]UIF88060.1 hypothetical protein KAF44_22810 [Cupriavidus necator]UIF89063.1 hypothetical protein KAF44_28305 [Cupriavidus necator]UIF89313.1 hypothetical protein KAF44_30610 [Cupriavidus necator]